MKLMNPNSIGDAISFLAALALAGIVNAIRFLIDPVADLCQQQAPMPAMTAESQQSRLQHEEKQMSFTLKKGQTRSLTLDSDHGKGYWWQATVERGTDGLAPAAVYVSVTPPENTDNQTVTFRAQHEGKSCVKLRYARYWDQEQDELLPWERAAGPLRTITVNVDIQP